MPKPQNPAVARAKMEAQMIKRLEEARQDGINNAILVSKIIMYNILYNINRECDYIVNPKVLIANRERFDRCYQSTEVSSASSMEELLDAISKHFHNPLSIEDLIEIDPYFKKFYGESLNE